MTEDERIEENEQETIQGVKQPNFLVPDLNEIKNVELLPSALSEQRKTKTKPNLNRFEFEESLLPELKPLAFTVGENFFDLAKVRGDLKPKEVYLEEKIKHPERKVGAHYIEDSPNIHIEKRGLLQLINGHKAGSWEGSKAYERTTQKHIELQFPTQNGFKPTEWERKNYGESHFDKLAKTKIHFEDIESISITKGIFKRNLVIKLKPEIKIHRLFIDKVEREITITIERKDFKLVEQVMTTILTQVNEIELRKIL